MTQILSVVDRKVAYIESHGNFTENRRICRDDQTCKYKQNRINLFLSLDNSDIGSIFFHKNEVLTTQKSCRYLSIQIERNLSFDKQLNKTLRKMADAIRSIYLIRHQIPLSALLLLKSLVLSHLSFSAIFFQNLSAKDLKRLNRQINWGLTVSFLRKKYDKARDLLMQTKTLPAELIIAKMSLIKFHHDIARPMAISFSRVSKNFHGYLILLKTGI